MVAYTVVLNSLKGTGATNSSKTYLFDWSVFQPGKYSVSFSYIGKDDTLDGTKLPSLHAQLGGSKVYTTGTTIASQPFAFLGTLRVGTLPNNVTYLQAESQTNPSIYLDSRPSSQQFTVEIQDETGALFLDQGAGAPGDINSYILTLFFTLLE